MGRVIGFHQFPVLIVFCVDQGNKALVLLRRFIDQLEDTSCTCKTHRDQGYLVGTLSHGLCQLSGHAKEGDDDADRHRAETAKGQVRSLAVYHQTAYDRQDHIHQVTHIAQNRHQRVAVLVCRLTVAKQLLIVL